MAGRIPIPKTQKEILVNQQVPFDVERGNPNNSNNPNRATQTSFRNDNTKPFITIEERNNYELEILELMEDKYGRLNGSGYYGIKTLTSLVELFSKCEKQSTGAFMFKNLLQLVKEYCDGKKDFYQIIGYSKRV